VDKHCTYVPHLLPVSDLEKLMDVPAGNGTMETNIYRER
jgi:hypothetical protein